MEREAAAESALTALRPALAADGFDLRLDRFDGADAVVVLEAKPEACSDCMVPDDMLVSILETAMHEADGGIEHVVLTKIGFERLTAH
jgi:Fe-S cluster biogenesis protein NfuA